MEFFLRSEGGLHALSDGFIGRGYAGILDPKISRRHARLVAADGGFMVDALGRNGIQVHRRSDGATVDLKPGMAATHLRVGDELFLLPGQHCFTLVGKPAVSMVPKPAPAEAGEGARVAE